jgi:hypothetical protein
VDDVKPIGQVVQMERGDYYELSTRLLVADAAAKKADAAIAAKEQLLKELALKYGFDSAFSRLQSNDETLEFSFS